MGYTNVRAYEGGKQDWIEAGMPTEGGKIVVKGNVNTSTTPERDVAAVSQCPFSAVPAGLGIVYGQLPGTSCRATGIASLKGRSQSARMIERPRF